MKTKALHVLEASNCHNFAPQRNFMKYIPGPHEYSQKVVAWKDVYAYNEHVYG